MIIFFIVNWLPLAAAFFKGRTKEPGRVRRSRRTRRKPVKKGAILTRLRGKNTQRIHAPGIGGAGAANRAETARNNPPRFRLPLLFSCCCSSAAAALQLLLLFSCCCTSAAAALQLLLHFSCCCTSAAAALWLLHSGCCTLAAAL